MMKCDTVVSQSCERFLDSVTQKEVYRTAEEEARYPGGELSLARYLRQKFSFRSSDDITKPIFVGFVVDTNGTLIGARILNKKRKLTISEKELLKIVYKCQSGLQQFVMESPFYSSFVYRCDIDFSTVLVVTGPQTGASMQRWLGRVVYLCLY